MSNSECPVCGEEWAWANPNARNMSVSCAQADRFCLTDEVVYLHGGGAPSTSDSEQ